MSDEAPAKPVHNLALRVFQRYYAELCEALSSCHEEVAAVLYSNELVTRQERSQVEEGLELTKLEKASILVQAVERHIVATNSSVPLKKFCQVLRRRHGVGSVVSRMKVRLAYVEQHHQLPNDEWSSDTECEQRPSSPAKEDLPQVENLSIVVKRHSHYLKELYKEHEGMRLKWPPVLIRDFVNVRCIESTDKRDEKRIKKSASGHIEKVKKTRTPIQLRSITSTRDGSRTKCILVEGAPGSGKTMFSWEVCRRWGQGELLQQYPLVVMLPLRDSDIQKVSSAEHMFPHDHKPYQREVTKAVEQEFGKGVLFVLDGFDELPAHKRDASSFWMKLITGKILPLATVMVTSRPWAIKTLLKSEHNSRISQHIEVVGFTSNNINEYITRAFTDCKKRKSFREYLARYPHIRSSMYVPLNCAIVVEVYKSAGPANPAPKTMTQLYTALVKTLLQSYMESHPEGFTISSFVERMSSFIFGSERVGFLNDFPSSVYQQLCALSELAYKGLRNNQKLIFSELPTNLETFDLIQKVPQLYNKGKGSASYNFLHLTVQEFLAALHIVHQGTGEQEKVLKGEVVFKGPTLEKKEVMLGGSDSDTDSSLSEIEESEYEEMESGRSVVAMFVAGLSELKQCKLFVPEYLFYKNIGLLHLLFESQNEFLTTSMLGNEGTFRTVSPGSMRINSHDAYVLGYCISLSRCQWKLALYHLGDEHIDMMKQAISSWGYGKGRIITVDFSNGRLTSDGVHHLLSLPHNSLCNLSSLQLRNHQLDFKSCEVLTNYLSSLPHLERLFLGYNQIGCGGAHLLSQSLHTNTTLRQLDVGWNNIGDRGGCSLAKALSINKSLEQLDISGNPLGEKSIAQLIYNLHLKRTFQQMVLPLKWQKFSQKCAGYNEAKRRLVFIEYTIFYAV